MILVKEVIVNNSPGNKESAVKKSTIFNVLATSLGFPILLILIVKFSGPVDSPAASTIPIQPNVITIPQTAKINNPFLIVLSLHCNKLGCLRQRLLSSPLERGAGGVLRQTYTPLYPLFLEGNHKRLKFLNIKIMSVLYRCV